MSISAKPYKGTRDLYPKQSVISGKNVLYMEHQNYLFTKIKEVLNIFGFNEYRTSIIENKQAFVEKSGGDLGSLELYNFVDKGGREIALRPELTLSSARAISNIYSQLRFPLRWFSIDNCFRYERPQKGRSREFWQAEVNIIGKDAGEVDLEVIVIALEILRKLNAKKEDYVLYYSSRPALEEWVKLYNLEGKKQNLFGILDNWFKLKSIDEKQSALNEYFDGEDSASIYDLATKKGKAWDDFKNIIKSFPEMNLIYEVLDGNENYNAQLNACIIRGQAYYTGMVFEIFDSSRENNRSLFGGGRFDDLLDLYGKKSPAVGFAPSDVSLNEFMVDHDLYPNFDNKKNKALICKDIDFVKEFYKKQVSNMVDENIPFELDYDYHRSENKRIESNIKRGNVVQKQEKN